jgi:hypothetical protein
VTSPHPFHPRLIADFLTVAKLGTKLLVELATSKGKPLSAAKHSHAGGKEAILIIKSHLLLDVFPICSYGC